MVQNNFMQSEYGQLLTHVNALRMNTPTISNSNITLPLNNGETFLNTLENFEISTNDVSLNNTNSSYDSVVSKKNNDAQEYNKKRSPFDEKRKNNDIEKVAHETVIVKNDDVARIHTQDKKESIEKKETSESQHTAHTDISEKNSIHNFLDSKKRKDRISQKNIQKNIDIEKAEEKNNTRTIDNEISREDIDTLSHTHTQLHKRSKNVDRKEAIDTTTQSVLHNAYKKNKDEMAEDNDSYLHKKIFDDKTKQKNSKHIQDIVNQNKNDEDLHADFQKLHQIISNEFNVKKELAEKRKKNNHNKLDKQTENNIQHMYSSQGMVNSYHVQSVVETNTSMNVRKTSVFSNAHSQLQNFVQNDFMKQARLFIHTNGSGEIKLELQPRELGDVKYTIKLDENSISARVVVENEVVKEIVLKNIDQLSKQFLQEGYEIGDFTVSVDSKNTDDNTRDDKNMQKTAKSMDLLDKSIEFFEKAYLTVSDKINLIA